MENDDSEAKALGEILVTMISAGASTEVLGRFAILYRNRLSTAGQPASLVELGPVLEEFATAVAHRLGAVPADARPATSPAIRKADRAQILPLVVNGKRTSVSIPTSLHDRCLALLGPVGFKSVLSDIAGKPAPDGGRSRQVQSELQDLVVRYEVGAASSPGDATVQ